MKKILIILLVLMAMATCLAYPSAQNGRTTFRNGYAMSGNPSRDNFQKWAEGVEGDIVGLGTGKVWYVDSGASDPGDGISWNRAAATFDAIWAFIDADGGSNRGDIVKVAEGHNEPFTTADAADMDVAGVTVIGYGSGSLMPTFDYDQPAGKLVFGASNITIVNLRFRCSTDGITTAIDIEAGVDYPRIINCEFGFAETSTDEFASMITASNSEGGVVRGCLIDAGAASTVNAIELSNTNLWRISDNDMLGDYSTAQINPVTVLSTNYIVEDNLLWNGSQSGLNTEPVFEAVSGSTGIVCNNQAAANLATVAAAFVGNRTLFFANEYNEDEGGGFTGVALGSVDLIFHPASVTPSADD